MRLPVRARLTLVSTGLSAAVLVVAGAALLVGFRSELRRTVDDGLASRFAAAAGDPVEAVEEQAGTDEAFAQFVDADGTVVLATSLVEPLLPRSTTDALRSPRFLDAEVRTREEVVPVRILAGPVGEGILVLAVDIEDQREAIARLTALVAIGGPVVLAALALLGWILAGAALRPVERLRSEAAAISTIEPARRLPLPATGDELERLAETLNGMLDRLHEGLDRERRLVDEASHELRTPLGIVRAEVDLALREPRSREELEAALRSVQQEVERLGRLTEHLLVLARSDRGRLPVHRTDTDVAELLRSVTRGFERRAEAGGVRIRVQADGSRATVDADRIRQALENLLDNAIRHVGSGGEVEVTARRDGEGLHLVVRDSGPGFPETLLPRAFERFARDDERRGGAGAGLGLAIVRAVAQAHGGRATAENLPDGGAAVAIHVPA